MSTSSPPLSSSINNQSDDHSGEPDYQNQDQLEMDQQQAASTLVNNYRHYHVTHHAPPPPPPTTTNTTISPRIPRKRSAIHIQDLENDQDDDPQKPILPSPSIIVTGTPPHYPMHPHHHLHHGQPPPSSLTSPSEGEDYEDEKELNQETGGLLKKSKPPPQASSWIQMDDYKKPSKKKSENGGVNGGQELSQDDRKIDVSLYTTKKNVAQGMLDIALLSANCSQLKYLLYHFENGTTNIGQSSTSSPLWFWGQGKLDFYFATNLLCIALSILLQVIIGILLILNSRHNVYVLRYQKVADSYSNWILLAVFIVTVVNIFLSVFISAR